MKYSEKEEKFVRNSAMKESQGCLTAYTYVFRSIPFALKNGVYRIFILPVSVFFAVFVIATILGIIVSFVQSVASVYPVQHALGLMKAQLALQVTLIIFLMSFLFTFIAFTDVFRQITLKTEDIMKGKKVKKYFEIQCGKNCLLFFLQMFLVRFVSTLFFSIILQINGVLSALVPPVGMVVTLGVMGIMNSVDSIFFYHIARGEILEGFRWIWMNKAMFFGFTCSNIVIMWTPFLNLSGIFLACMTATRMIIHEKMANQQTSMNVGINDPDAHCDLGQSITAPHMVELQRDDDDDDDEGDIELEGLNKSEDV